MSWQPENGRWAAIKEAWIEGESRLHLIWVFLTSFPVWLYGEKAYYESEIKYGDQTWWAPHNLMDELMHFSFGLIFTLPFIPWPAISFMMIAVIFGLAMSQEYFIDAKDSGLHFKNVLDALCWTLGAIASTAISLSAFAG